MDMPQIWPAEDEPSAIQGELSFDSALSPPKERQADRVSVAMAAALRQRGAAPISVAVLDLSTDGFQMDTHLELEIGTPVWLRLPGLESSAAKIVWRDGHRAGCKFDRPLHPAVLAMVVKRCGHA